MRIGRQTLLIALAGMLASITIGCQGRASVPSDAMLQQSGRGGLSYTANQPGNVYVLDTDANEKVFEGHMNNGDQIVVNPRQDRIVLGGNDADHRIGLKPDHNYEIRFAAAH